mgnify:CR=1 FL=1
MTWAGCGELDAMSVTETPALRLYGDTGATPPDDLHPNGVNHLAISTADMKAQLTFFAEASTLERLSRVVQTIFASFQFID